MAPVAGSSAGSPRLQMTKQLPECDQRIPDSSGGDPKALSMAPDAGSCASRLGAACLSIGERQGACADARRTFPHGLSVKHMLGRVLMAWEPPAGPAIQPAEAHAGQV